MMMNIREVDSGVIILINWRNYKGRGRKGARDL